MLAAVATEVDARRPWLGPAVVAAGVVAAGLYVAAVDPNEAGHYPSCPVQALTGLDCPGCGSLRAVHALAHLDLGAAVGLNILTVIALPLLAVMFARWTVRRLGRGAPAVAAPRALWGLAAIVAAFTVARNLPVGAALAP